MSTPTGQGLKIQENIPLSRYTTFQIGGPAKFFCEVKNEKELEDAVIWAKDKKIAAFVLGGGSNVLVSDNGFDGLVIKMTNGTNENFPSVKMKMEGGKMYLECWAGENLSNIMKMAADSSLAGLEWAAGIPGTVGGAVRGNAGAFGGCIENNIEAVRVYDMKNLEEQGFRKENCQFAYRDSIFKQNEHLVVSYVILRLEKRTKAEIDQKIKENLERRNQKQPQGRSAGSVFKNPVVKNKQIIERFEKDKNVKCKDDKVPAGWLVAEAGLLGRKIGGARVSEDHGNFVLNSGDASAEDVIMLISVIKQKVRHEFEIELEEEIKYVGF